jgi:hypothetical protein
MVWLYYIYQEKRRKKMNNEIKNNWFVTNYNGELIGHDMSETAAKMLASQMQDEEPDQEWEAMN